MMSIDWRDKYTLWARRAFVRNFGMVHTAASKSTSSHVASIDSLLRTIVSKMRRKASRIVGMSPPAATVDACTEFPRETGPGPFGTNVATRRDANLISWILEFFAVQIRVGINLLADIAKLNRGSRCTPLLDPHAERMQIIGGDLAEQPPVEGRKNIAHNDGAPRHDRW